MSKCPWTSCVAGEDYTSSMVQKLGTAAQGKEGPHKPLEMKGDSRMATEQKQELAVIFGDVHFMFTGCATLQWNSTDFGSATQTTL